MCKGLKGLRWSFHTQRREGWICFLHGPSNPWPQPRDQRVAQPHWIHSFKPPSQPLYWTEVLWTSDLYCSFLFPSPPSCFSSLCWIWPAFRFLTSSHSAFWCETVKNQTEGQQLEQMQWKVISPNKCVHASYSFSYISLNVGFRCSVFVYNVSAVSCD